MADVKISGLPASTTPLAGTEVLPVVQGGITKRVSVDNLTAGKSVSVAGLTDSTLTATKPVFTDANKKLTSSGTLGVDQGGTGTSTALTTGSVVFAGGSGVYSQDSANLFWDDTNNRLGVGTNGPNARLQVVTANAALGSQANVMFTTSDAQGADIGATIGLGGSVTTASPTGNMRLFGALKGAKQNSDDADTAGYLSFFTMGSGTTTPTERGRFDSSGSFMVNTTSTSLANAANFSVFTDANTATTTTNFTGSANAGDKYSRFGFNGVEVGSISIVAGGASVAYNITSDYRLKESIAPLTGALVAVSRLKPCTYTWKSSGHNSQGFIAHELAEVCPDAVTGEKDAVNEDGSIKAQSIDTSFLVATLTAAIQELNAKVIELENKLGN